MAEIGKDCHIKLTHNGINGGKPYGFILEAGNTNNPGPVFSIQRVVDHEGEVSIRVFFDVLAADELINPDGSVHHQSRSEIYGFITAFLTCQEGISVETPVGIFSNVGAEGHSATELHYSGMSLISCQLNNVGPYYAPADPERFYASIWDGDMTWAEAYWR
jgi:hypothetical protein